MHATRQPLAQAGSSARLPYNFVYANPTISALSYFVMSLFGTNVGEDSASQSEREAKGMVSMVEKYSSELPMHNPGGAPAAKTVDEIVLVSGTSGRLGAHLLAQLLARPSVAKVYAVNRPSREGALDRQRSIFENWELDTKLLEGGKMVLLEGDFSKPDFGVGQGVYDEVCFRSGFLKRPLTNICTNIRFATLLRASSITVGLRLVHCTPIISDTITEYM